MKKYVNKADINSDAPADEKIVALIELLFFAYRDFVSDPDAMLDSLEFGRAHHRVVHFIGRNPGMTVAQLLDILRITKQSLSRVLKELIARDYVYQLAGQSDRRQRLLYLTDAGRALHQQLMAPQIARITRAAHENGVDHTAQMKNLLIQLISPENRDAVMDWLHQLRA